MIYPENYESKIGFNDIKALLSGFCQSDLGRERVGELHMLTEVGAIRQKLQESQELKTILEETVELPEISVEGYTFAWDTSVLNEGKMPADS